uniref:Uncharacterized protein n=1 Tax=Physcomitrium patens TaxID=3218 RepID=A0A2K1L3M4_PHYPA|nr:hypothetical protein PHYPA_003421 [Physcomitrium patens]
MEDDEFFWETVQMLGCFNKHCPLYRWEKMELYYILQRKVSIPKAPSHEESHI